MKQKVLFLCTHNSARSQMAEGILDGLYGDYYEAYSAGTEPGRVNPYAVAAMKEINIDISHHRSKGIDEFMETQFDVVVTTCDHAKEACPYFPKAKRIVHHGFLDPAAFHGDEQSELATFRQVRDEIRSWVETFFTKNLNAEI